MNHKGRKGHEDPKGHLGRLASVWLVASVFIGVAACASHAKPAAAPPAPPPGPQRSAAPGPGFSPNPPPSFLDPATGKMVSGPGIVGPRAIYAPTADFTDAARRDRVTGIVVMSVVVDATGRVESVSVFESLRDDLDRSAVTAMKTWRFEPAQNNGKTVPARINVEMSFNLK
jgi:periplasmic protein TonB